jgi:hypothetical protein
MKITHYEEWWFDSIPYFTTKSQPTLRPCANNKCNKEQVCVCMPCRYQALSSSRSQVLTVRITSSSVETSYHGLHPSGLQIGGNLRVLDRCCRVDGVNTVQPNFVMASRVLGLLCSLAMSCWSKISIVFLWGQTHLKHFVSSVSVLM